MKKKKPKFLIIFSIIICLVLTFYYIFFPVYSDGYVTTYINKWNSTYSDSMGIESKLIKEKNGLYSTEEKTGYHGSFLMNPANIDISFSKIKYHYQFKTDKDGWESKRIWSLGESISKWKSKKI